MAVFAASQKILEGAPLEGSILKLLLVVAAAASLGLVAIKALYELFFSPLSKIPGPKLAAITDLWLLNRLHNFEKCPSIHQCFLKYGPIVRLGPNKVAFNSIESIKPVYGIGTGFVKSKWYETWGLRGIQNIFTLIDRKEHSNRRRVASQTLAHSNLVRFTPDVNQHVRDFTSLCQRKLKAGERLELVTLYRYFALDVLSSALFGKDFSLLQKGRDHPFSADLDACVVVLPLRGYCPTWLWSLLQKIPYEHWQFLLGGERRLINYARDLVVEEERDPKPREYPTMVQRFLHHRDSNGEPIPHDIIIGEMANFFFAGTDTTSTTLTFLTWELASKPHIQQRLADEIKSKISKDRLPTIEEVMEWPYLNAVIKEGLRVYTAVPSHMERVVPAGGVTLDGYEIPAGTIVGTQSYSMHRNESIFPNPEAYNPERWFHETDEMRKYFMPFGQGSRVCIGQNLALLEIRLMLAGLIRKFELRVPDGFDYSSMAVRDRWLIFPKGHSLKLELIERDD